MLNFRLFRLIGNKQTHLRNAVRCFHHEFSTPEEPAKTQDNQSAERKRRPGGIRPKYKIFREEDAVEILDVEEERERFLNQDIPEATVPNIFEGINLNRGVHGVFDIEDLVEVLRQESMLDIFVCKVPKDLKYVDYMVTCSGRSYRHMLGTAEFVRKVYKMKRNKQDILPKIEGEKSRDWMAMDLGNIALHIFSPESREQYDLESLWAIGAKYDKECNKPEDPLVELFASHSTLLADIKPK